jgi:hypothetical protein
VNVGAQGFPASDNMAAHLRMLPEIRDEGVTLSQCKLPSDGISSITGVRPMVDGCLLSSLLWGLAEEARATLTEGKHFK